MQKTERDSKQESPDDFVLVRRVDAPGRFGSLPASAVVLAKSERDETSKFVGLLPLTPNGREDRKEVKGASILRAGATRNSQGKALAVSLPPRIQLSPAVSHTYRFRSTSASATLVTVASMLGALGGLCTAVNSKIGTWASSLKIIKVTVWPSGSTSGVTNATLSWYLGESAQVPDEAWDEAIPEGITATKALVFTPPPKSLCGFWIDSSDSAANLFAIQTSIGSVVDLQVAYRLVNVQSGLQITVVTGVLGTVYYLALDGPTSNTYVPIGLLSTS
jgi:hypothetical protein